MGNKPCPAAPFLSPEAETLQRVQKLLEEGAVLMDSLDIKKDPLPKIARALEIIEEVERIAPRVQGYSSDFRLLASMKEELMARQTELKRQPWPKKA